MIVSILVHMVHFSILVPFLHIIVWISQLTHTLYTHTHTLSPLWNPGNLDSYFTLSPLSFSLFLTHRLEHIDNPTFLEYKKHKNPIFFTHFLNTPFLPYLIYTHTLYIYIVWNFQLALLLSSAK